MLRFPGGRGYQRKRFWVLKRGIHHSHPVRASLGLGEQVMAWEMTGGYFEQLSLLPHSQELDMEACSHLIHVASDRVSRELES